MQPIVLNSLECQGLLRLVVFLLPKNWVDIVGEIPYLYNLCGDVQNICLPDSLGKNEKPVGQHS